MSAVREVAYFPRLALLLVDLVGLLFSIADYLPSGFPESSRRRFMPVHIAQATTARINSNGIAHKKIISSPSIEFANFVFQNGATAAERAPAGEMSYVGDVHRSHYASVVNRHVHVNSI